MLPWMYFIDEMKISDSATLNNERIEALIFSDKIR